MDEKYIEKIADNESRSKSNTKRVDKLESQYELLHEMNANIRVIAEKTKDQESELREVKGEIKGIKERPAKNWNTLTTAIITALVSGLAGAFLMLIIK